MCAVPTFIYCLTGIKNVTKENHIIDFLQCNKFKVITTSHPLSHFSPAGSLALGENGQTPGRNEFLAFCGAFSMLIITEFGQNV